MSADQTDRAEANRLLAEFHDMDPDDPLYPGLREKLVAEFLPLVHYLARKMAQRNDLLPDIVQVGSIGLLNAIDRFDPKRGLEFTTFAVPTIAGEIRRYFRDTGWCLHVPRRAQELQTAMREGQSRLEQELGRSPTLDELAIRLDVAPERVIEAKDVAASRHAVSTDSTADSDDSPDAMTMPTIEEGFARVEARAVLRPALAKLPRREREILMLRFYDERTQSEIADIVGVSQMQVSRLIARSLEQMRDALSVDERVPIPA